MKLIRYKKDGFVNIEQLTELQIHKKEIALRFGTRTIVVMGGYFDNIIDEIINNDDLRAFHHCVSRLRGESDD